MKKYSIIFSIMLLITLSFSSCLYRGFHIGTIPYENIGSKWVSEDPNIYYVVQEDGTCIGKLTKNGEEYDISVGFLYNEVDISIQIEDDDGNYTQSVYNGYSASFLDIPIYNKNSIKINDITEYDFDGNEIESEYNQITFKRVDSIE